MNAGQLIAGRYELRGVLGRGGMGEVYLAHDHRLTTDVALKRVPLELSVEPAIRDALISEARILAKLSHTNIVRLFDLADTEDGLFLVLEYVCGPSLDKVLLHRKTLSPQEVQHVMDQVCAGLGRAHSFAVIHRDLKPSNLLVALSGDERRYFLRDGLIPASLLASEIKVTDFGLAKVIAQTRMEISGTISGTPAYMAPEQFRGEPPSEETDIYALGYVAYVCLAGKLPIGNADPAYFHLNVTPPPLTDVPRAMALAIQKAVSKERKQRFMSVEGFLHAMREPLPQPAVAPPGKQTEAAQQKSPVGQRSRGNLNRRQFKLTRGLVVTVVILSVLSLIAAALFLRQISNTASPQNTRTASDSAPSAELALLPPLNPAPRIDVPPPVIVGAKLTTAPGLSRGIEHPEVLGALFVPGNQVAAFGSDGTLYVTRDHTNLGAVRNEQLIWQYELGGDGSRISVAPDGLLWVDSWQDNRLFCFNAAGQGGELMSAVAKNKFLPMVRKSSSPEPPARCVSEPGVELRNTAGSRQWLTPLDHLCNNDPVAGASGKVLVQTRSRNAYLLSGQGQVLWTYPASCLFDRTMLLADDTAIGLCSGRKSIIGIKGGQSRFTFTSKDQLSEAFAQDQASNFYRFVDNGSYDQHLLVKNSSAGAEIWSFPMKFPLTPDGVLSPDGKIYLFEMSNSGTILEIVGEHPH